MALSPGTRLGHYDVTLLLGEGGMGQVWQATDTKLNRQVALKVLPEGFTSDPDRLARFEREAKVLASLNHPGIAQIHGLEDSTNTKALVLELVKGPTLAERIAEGPIPVDEALPIAKQIAEALEVAHEAGVIHRDLKPANIKLRPDGTVKVLDFGLAKALDPTPSSDPDQSPTLTAAATQMGVVMGTAAYMSPEQAKGKLVDEQTDVWAFGAVLYEMLTAIRAFSGDDVSDTLAAVLRAEVDVATLPNEVPHRIRQTLSACLQREPRQRAAHMQDVRLAMEGMFETVVELSPGAVGASRFHVWQQPWTVFGMATAVIVTALAVWSVPNSQTPRLPTRFKINVPPDVQVISGFGLAVSPDGRTVLFVASGPQGQGLYRQSLGEIDPVRVPGVDQPWIPFFSPNGEWVGYTDQRDNTVKKIRLDGSTNPVTLEAG